MKFQILQRILGEKGRTTRDAVIYSLGRGGSGLVGLWSIPLLVRVLGAETYGVFSLMVFELTLLTQITVGWLQQTTVRYRQEWIIKKLVNQFDFTQMRLALLAIGVSVLSMLGLAHFNHQYSISITALLAVTAGLSGLQAVWLSNAMADLRAIRLVVAELLRVTVPLVLIYLAHLLGMINLSVVVLAIAVGWSASAALLIYGKKKLIKPAAIDFNLIREMLRFGLPMIIWFLLNALQPYLGRIMLQKSDYVVDFGIYCVIQDLAMKAGTVTLMPIVYSVHASGMALLARGDTEAANQLIQRAQRVHALLIIVAVGAWSLFKELIAFILVGADNVPQFIAHSWMGSILLIGTLLSQTALLAHKRLEFLGRTDLMVYLSAMALVLGTFLTWLLLETLGGIASALGLLSCSLFYILSAEFIGRRVHRKIAMT